MEISELPKDKKIILFDGVCNLCNNAIQYIIKYDKKDIFRFVSIQSELGQSIINHIRLQDKNIDSIILYESKKAYYVKSKAVKEIMKGLNPFQNFISYFIPNKKLGSIIYDNISKNRYKWFGKKEICLLPTLENKSKFLT